MSLKYKRLKDGVYIRLDDLVQFIMGAKAGSRDFKDFYTRLIDVIFVDKDKL